MDNLNIVKMPILPNQFINLINLQSTKQWAYLVVCRDESKIHQEKEKQLRMIFNMLKQK